jgi:hypothetical protein
MNNEIHALNILQPITNLMIIGLGHQEARLLSWIRCSSSNTVKNHSFHVISKLKWSKNHAVSKLKPLSEKQMTQTQFLRFESYSQSQNENC